MWNYIIWCSGICFFKGLWLLFLPNVPGATFIQGATFHFQIFDVSLDWKAFQSCSLSFYKWLIDWHSNSLQFIFFFPAIQINCVDFFWDMFLSWFHLSHLGKLCTSNILRFSVFLFSSHFIFCNAVPLQNYYLFLTVFQQNEEKLVLASLW